MELHSIYATISSMKDRQVKKIIDAEIKRQKRVINLIPSENYVSSDVREAVGSVLDNKYAEGYPHARYYGGNENIDAIELLCQRRARGLFGLKEKDWHVNCQAHSGSPANLAVYLALVPHATFDASGKVLTSPGKIMGMTLASGGHLTHGQKVSATGKFWKQINFDVNPQTGTIDYMALRKQAIREKPNLIVAGFTAYPRKVDFAEFRKISDACKAILMVDMSHIAGLVAGKVHMPPFPYADIVTTTTHKTLRGPRGALIFAKKNFIDKNGILGKKGEILDLGKKIDKAVFPGLQGGPHMSHIAGITVALGEAKTLAFKKYAKQVMKNASSFSKEIMKLGWNLVSNGTDTHLILIDTWMNGKISKDGTGGIPGKIAEVALERDGIICNKNTIPGETRSAFDPSGIRLGTSAETTRGKKEKDFINIARKIDRILRKAQANIGQ